MIKSKQENVVHNLKEILNKIPETTIAVIGDICLDAYYFLKDEKGELSLESGLKTNSVLNFKHEAGAAGNVAINLKKLGVARVDMYGIIGPDPFGKIVQEILTDSGVNCRNIQIQDRDWDTHVFHKIFEEGLEKPRYDIGNFNSADDTIIQSLLAKLESNLPLYDAVIINEQVVYGCHTALFQEGLCKLIDKNENCCIWLTDCRHFNNVYDKSIRKLNKYEALALYDEIHSPSADTPTQSELVSWLYTYWGKPVVITLGEEGAVAMGHDGKIIEVEGINLIGLKDTVGAGDAFLSGFAATLAAGESLEDALALANISATVSVKKLFETGHPTVQEILEVGKSPDYRYNPTLAKNIRKAVYLDESPIELIGVEKTRFPKVVIFDHDGTISTLREGWEPIMREMMVEAILGKQLKSVSAAEMEKVADASGQMIEKTTGVQTIIQMHHLQDMVHSFGFVPKEEVLTPGQYKQIYNKKLMAKVSKRVESFKNGDLSLDDVTMKGSISFLKSLRSSGVTLFLVSGTDQDDVKNEAEVLGYADYFNGGIFGSVGDVQNDPKKVVIESIINKLPGSISPEECYVFGDGPVEMREAAKRGFSRVGVLSDEEQGSGVNLQKRPRLILAGAQALIPDFSWIFPLTDFLGWGTGK